MPRTVITYERGTTYVKHRTTGALGLVGELQVGAYCFDTVERFVPAPRVDYPHLVPQDYMKAVMYWWKPTIKPGDSDEDKEKKRKNPGKRVMNPVAGGSHVNILLHFAANPSWLLGCIAPGFLGQDNEAATLSYSSQAMEMIYEQCGGRTSDRNGWDATSPLVCFRVLNAFPNRAGLTLVGS